MFRPRVDRASQRGKVPVSKANCCVRGCF